MCFLTLSISLGLIYKVHTGSPESVFPYSFSTWALRAQDGCAKGANPPRTTISGLRGEGRLRRSFCAFGAANQAWPGWKRLCTVLPSLTALSTWVCAEGATILDLRRRRNHPGPYGSRWIGSRWKRPRMAEPFGLRSPRRRQTICI